MVETAFGNLTVEDVIGKEVARTVFIGEADQAAGFVVVVTEGMAQGIGASGRQTVLAVFVGSGMAFAVGMGFQTTLTRLLGLNRLHFSCFYIAELLTLCSIVSFSNISFSLFLLERK